MKIPTVPQYRVKKTPAFSNNKKQPSSLASSFPSHILLSFVNVPQKT